MEISKGIKIIEESLWMVKEQILIISDIHLGYEEYMHKKGILVPKQQAGMIIDKLNGILELVKPKKVIINGDLKHDFRTISNQEWKDTLKLIEFLQSNCEEIVLVKGNHDNILNPIAIRKNLKVVDNYLINDTLITHGDKLIETKAKRIIIGHEHPSIGLRDKSKLERFKCFLKGKWKKKELIVMPSLNPLSYGSDIIVEKRFSPFLDDISKFEVFVVSKGEVFAFGKVKNLS